MTKIINAATPYILAVILFVVMIFMGRHYRQKALDQAVNAHNALAAAESTAQIEIGQWQRRAFIAEGEKELLEHASEKNERRIRDLNARIRESHNVSVSVDAELRGTSAARHDSTDTYIPIDIVEYTPTDTLRAQGGVKIQDHAVPATAPIDVDLRITTSLGFNIVVFDDPETGGPAALLSTTSPWVKDATVHSIVDRRNTALDDSKPSRLKWFATGLAAGVGVSMYLASD